MISIVICSIDPEKFSRVGRNYASVLGGESYEIIGIHDARSLAEAYNRGVRRSRGEIIIFSHDDIEILSGDLAAGIRRHLQLYDLVGPAGTSKVVDGYWPRAGAPHMHGMITQPAPATLGSAPYVTTFFGCSSLADVKEPRVSGIQALDGVWLALRREVAERIAFDEATFQGFHGYDIDFTYRAFLGGFTLAVHYDIALIHESTGKFDVTWQEANRRFQEKHYAKLGRWSGSANPQDDWIHILCQDKADVLRCYTSEARAEVRARNAPAITADGHLPATRGGWLRRFWDRVARLRGH